MTTEAAGVVYVEIGPIFAERFYSGIPNVVVRLIEEFLRLGLKLRYFHGANLIDGAMVEVAVAQRTNTVFREAGSRCFVGTLSAGTGILPGLGVFTNSRHGLPRMFARECQIVYDLTPLITPQFHHADTISFHLDQYRNDFGIPDYFVAISESTKRDILAYLPNFANKPLYVALLSGEELLPGDRSFLKSDIDPLRVEPYYLFVGTIEPRKNLGLLFRLFAKYPEVLKHHKWVICGRNGWLIDFDDLVKEIEHLAPALRENVVRFEYVSQLEKLGLMRKAKAFVFPSHYEGFGLPVLEALALGCPVIASFSSSIPEAGGDVTTYFDPTDVDSLYHALMKFDRDAQADRGGLQQRMRQHVERFSWRVMAETVLKGGEACLDA